MRLLTGRAVPDSGTISVLGHDLPAESKLARARMGVCPQTSNLDVDLTVREVLEVFARLYRVAPGRGRPPSRTRSSWPASSAAPTTARSRSRAACSDAC